MCHYNLEVASVQRCARQSSFVPLASTGTTFFLAFSFGFEMFSRKQSQYDAIPPTRAALLEHAY
jgi:hypothetical protein